MGIFTDEQFLINTTAVRVLRFEFYMNLVTSNFSILKPWSPIPCPALEKKKNRQLGYLFEI